MLAHVSPRSVAQSASSSQVGGVGTGAGGVGTGGTGSGLGAGSGTGGGTRGSGLGAGGGTIGSGLGAGGGLTGVIGEVGALLDLLVSDPPPVIGEGGRGLTGTGTS